MRSSDPLNTYLLRVFSTLVEECSVSRTALLMNQSQPAISGALKRLREVLGDPLLVREKGGMVPTARALELLVYARSALGEIDRMTDEPEQFVPLSSNASFRIGAPDYLAPEFFIRLVKRFRDEAPNATLTLHSLGPDFDFERSLADGRLDLVIGNWPEPPDRMRLSVLTEDEIVCLVSASHPLCASGMTLEDYMRATHVVPLNYAPTLRGVIDHVLAGLKLSRKERVVAQSFNIAPYMLEGTDLVFTTTRHFANFYAEMLSLRVLPAPIDYPKMRFYLLWHDRNHHAPSHRWVRAMLSDCGQALSGA